MELDQLRQLDAIAREPRVSFCVVDQDRVVPEEYTTYFRSVIVFGRASVIDDDEGRRKAADRGRDHRGQPG